MEIFPHIHRIESSVADRNLYQFLVVGDHTVLIDTGASNTPAEVIAPYLQKIGLPLSRVELAINTHADADHHGGNGSLREMSAKVQLGCGRADKTLIEDPDVLFASRYNQWIADHGVGLGTNPEASEWVRAMIGAPTHIDTTYAGGEEIQIDGKRTLRVLHVPGHSDGHLAFYDAANRAVFVGDALHGSFCPNQAGQPSLPPAYYSVAAYLGTLQAVEGLDVEWIHSAHWPVYHAGQVREFLTECRWFVDKASVLLLEALERHPDGITLQQAMRECGPVLGTWPENNRWLLMYPLHGHFTDLERQGRVVTVRGGEHFRWKLVAS